MPVDVSRITTEQYDEARALRWDSATRARSDAADLKAHNAGVRHIQRAGESQFPDPRSKFGYPGKAKGAIYALDPDDHSRGDVLYFSRYPTDLTEKIEALLASENLPGRAYPVFQMMGAKGVQLSTELWFCDAHMWSMGRTMFVTMGAPEYNGVAGDPIDFIGPTPIQTHRPLGTLAEQARKFFEFYMVGHDGTGLALPPVDMFLHWGGRLYPIPIVIKSVDIKQEDFTSEDTPLNDVRGDAGTPQTITARLEMEIYQPLRTVNVFQPKKPGKPRSKAPKVKTCVSPGQLPDGTDVLVSFMNASGMALAAEVVGATAAPRGFLPPSNP